MVTPHISFISQETQPIENFKQCKTCQQLKPLIEFHRNHLTKDKHASSCKPCAKIYNDHYHAINREEENAKKREKHALNKDIDNARSKRWYEGNRDRMSKHIHQQRVLNHDKVIAQEKKSRDKNRIKIRERQKQQRIARKEDAIARQERNATLPKFCPQCHETKRHDDFYKDNGTSDGYAAYCKTCQKEKGRQYYQENQDAVIQKTKEYATMHREKLRPYFRLTATRRRARMRGLPDTFTLQDQEFCARYWDYACAVCRRQNGLWYTVVFDHWEPIKSPTCPGTIAGNILPLCHGKKGKPLGMEKCCNQVKQAKDPVLWINAYFITKYGPKRGPRRAKAKLKEITTFFEKARLFALQQVKNTA